MAFTHYDIVSNGIRVDARYNPERVEKVFLPLLRRLTQMQAQVNKRVIVYLAAPPGTGKTTLSLFLEQLSKEHEDITDIQCIGLDGFHHYQQYLTTHRGVVYGKDVMLVDVKGAPETYDFEKLRRKILELKKGDTMWPVYDRQNLHDVVEDQIHVTGDIVLIEGNWLLLKDKGWNGLKDLCDYCIFIDTKEEYVRERLILRKMNSNITREQSEQFYANADGRNVIRTLQDSMRDAADLILEMQQDGDYIVKQQ